MLPDGSPSYAEAVLATMPEALAAHTTGVMHLAAALAPCHGLDTKACLESALFHDAAKAMPTDRLSSWTRLLRLDTFEMLHPSLAHGKQAALFMQQAYKVRDRRVLHAVRYHTTGRAGAGPYLLALYLCDFAEPGRGGVLRKKIFTLGTRDLEAACLEACVSKLRNLLPGRAIHPRAVRFYNDLLERISFRQ